MIDFPTIFVCMKRFLSIKMKENKYNDSTFFTQYSKMLRSTKGLNGAGEWHILKQMMPDFSSKRVLDLGCGFGWHCIYAVEHGAASVVGIDISEKMIKEAKKRNPSPLIEYKALAIEDYDFQPNTFDVVISSLTLHYLESFENICQKINRCLEKGGSFIFSVEHPIFTAYGNQDWFYDEEGNRLHWPIDKYFYQGKRNAIFLGEEVVKYHKTLTTYMNGLLQNGFEIKELIEPEPGKVMLDTIPEMKDELRRPMMLIISAQKK